MINWISPLVAVLMFFHTGLEAQVVIEKTRTMSLGTQNALIVDIPDADDRLIIKKWKDYIGEYGKVKRDRKADEYYALEVKIPSISGAGTLDVYGWARDGQMITFFNTGNGFISSETHPTDYRNAVLFLTEFSYTIERHIVNEELEEQQDELDDLVKDLEKLERLNEDYKDNIEKAKEAIARAEDNIEQNIADQARKRKEIEKQEEVLEEVRSRLGNVGKK